MFLSSGQCSLAGTFISCIFLCAREMPEIFSLALYPDEARRVLRLAVVYGDRMSRLGQISMLQRQPSPASALYEWGARVWVRVQVHSRADTPSAVKKPDCPVASDRRGFFYKHTRFRSYRDKPEKYVRVWEDVWGVRE